MKTALTIAGSDSSGGAGIQADIKTISAMGVYAMSAITALTAQNTRGVMGIMEVNADFLGKQIDAVFTDIYPDSVKIGMVSSDKLICKIAEKLREHDAKNIVVDPVMVATSGAGLIREDAVEALRAQLLSVADLVTRMGLDGVVATNTTIDHDLGEGGLSGAPLLPRSLEVVRRLRARLGEGPTVIGVGGISSIMDAELMLDAGADLLQAYTAFVYNGPAWPGRLNRTLATARRR